MSDETIDAPAPGKPFEFHITLVCSDAEKRILLQVVPPVAIEISRQSLMRILDAMESP